ncbi:hypothetical protein LMH87_009943 [Akanthomyces muscarius]|uniref:propanoyl-CoA C-acyltransferase n=1 Tax=Akanthomyces muscarius TaxID=2231603 RepID=A0A9W8QEJ6_AKAMU|nr:hypothetical protein LMH87_009943 [Akanthomyces muscarius]KAJ4153458.1 hypothetical protein LMH87_009943 [Akanthomyces muscarius]
MAAREKMPAYVLGVGLTEFIKPRGLRDYPELGYEAGIKAMLDAQINYDDVQTGIAGFNFGDSTCGQRVFYQFGMTSIPIINTGNACATGSAGLYLARTMIQSGALDCVLVVGFEKMEPGHIKDKWTDRAKATELSRKMMEDMHGPAPGPPNAQYFGNAGREYMEKYGAKAEDFAEIARISHKHSQRNPYAQFRQEYSLQEVLDSTMIYPPLTKLQCSPTSDGAGAAVVVSQRFLDARPAHLRAQAVLMAGQQLTTDSASLYSRSSIQLVGYDMTQRAVAAALREAQTSLDDIKVCELHDCFSANELILLESIGFSGVGKAHEMVRRGDITYGGRVVVNPSGGLISKGHPLGATGLAQCAELVWQLRGWANNRLVKDIDVALQHNLGLGGATVVTVYKRADGRKNAEVSNEEIAKSSWLGYNPAVEARGFREADAAKVRSRTARSEFALSDTQKKIEARL